MIEGFLIVIFLKCNNPPVDKNQQTPTLIADFQIRHQKKVACTDFNSLCQFKTHISKLTIETSFSLPPVRDRSWELEPCLLFLPNFVYSSWRADTVIVCDQKQFRLVLMHT